MVRERIFERHKSVFKEWVVDTGESIKECIDHDAQHWKIDKLLKDDPVEIAGVMTVFMRNAEALKNEYIR